LNPGFYFAIYGHHILTFYSRRGHARRFLL
jgi:hypothetical protein